MPDRILVPFDGSPHSRKALEYALEEYPDTEITVFHVLDPIDAGYSADPMGVDFPENWYEAAKRREETLFEDADALAREHGRQVETASDVGRPARTILEYAEETGVDAIVMGSHGRRGAARILLGSVAETVVRRAPIPVTVIR